MTSPVTTEALVDGDHDMPTEAEIQAMREEAENFRLPAPPPTPVRGRFYLTECEHCGWVGSSEQCGDGGGPDYDDVICPVCCASMLGDGPNEAGAAKHGEAVYQRIVQAEASLATATSELAWLRAEGEAKDRALKELQWAQEEASANLASQRYRSREAARAADALTELREDAARLDFLDECNARLNASYGTHYGWKLVLNHNVNRLVLGDMKVDLHDSEGGNDKLPSCRLAIDEARARTALAARAATAREGQAEEATEDADFAIVYRTARGDMDFEQMARVLSARLRQMDKRAKAANQRADAAEARIGAPGTD